jgi:hypothetical protein
MYYLEIFDPTSSSTKPSLRFWSPLLIAKDTNEELLLQSIRDTEHAIPRHKNIDRIGIRFWKGFNVRTHQDWVEYKDPVDQSIQVSPIFWCSGVKKERNMYLLEGEEKENLGSYQQMTLRWKGGLCREVFYPSVEKTYWIHMQFYLNKES